MFPETKKQTFQKRQLLICKIMSKQPEAIPAVRRKPERVRHPAAATPAPLMDTLNIVLKSAPVNPDFFTLNYNK